MQLLYLGEHDVDDIAKWSGIPYYLSRALAGVFDAMKVVQVPDFARLEGSVDARLRYIGEVASRAVRDSGADVVFCQGMSVPPYLDSPVPSMYWHDATHFGLERQPMQRFAAAHPELRAWDERLLATPDVLAYASQWAVTQCQEVYGVPSRRLMVLPFGANLADPPDEAAVSAAIDRRPRERCELLFLGRRWKRKGLPRAVEVARRLIEQGLPTRLTVIGCEPEDAQVCAPDFVELLGFLRKDDAADRDRLRVALERSHFLVHPARFEAFGIALVEANAYGVPALASDVAGITTAVAAGRNGEIFPLAGFVDGAVAAILASFRDDAESYRMLALSAWNETRSRLSWEVGARRLRERAERLLAGVH